MLLLLALACRTEVPAPMVVVQEPDRDQLVRLTHEQYRNAVRDVLDLDGPPDVSLIGDPLAAGGFDNDVAVLEVTPELWVDYALAAERITRELITDEAAYQRLAPEDPHAVEQLGETIEFDWTEGVATIGAAVEDGWRLWSWGSLDFTLALEPGPYHFEAIVWAAQSGDEIAVAALQLNGVDLRTAPIEAADRAHAQVIGVDVNLSAGQQVLGVRFTNDHPEGRNLFVGGIRLTPRFVGPPGGDAERDAWIERLGRRFHRRPLSPNDRALYQALFDEGSRMALTGRPFQDGVATVTMAMLQSPWFVYRSELAVRQGAEGERLPLDDYELASKLSFALWNTTPSDELLERADRGEVRANLRSIAGEMLDDPRALAAIDHFHEQQLGLSSYANIHKEGALAEAWSPALNEVLREQALRQTRHAVTEGWSTFELYSRPEHWVAPELASLYGVPTPSDWTLLDVTGQRSGLLTLPGFLALNATATDVDSIHRGVFVNHRVLCADLPAPPNSVPPLPAGEPGESNRERVTRHTGPGTCGGECHGTLINPAGFAFESYDGLGRWRDEDHGPIDASGTYTFSDGARSWRTPMEFNALLADSPDAHRCFVGSWGRFLLGRTPTVFDRAGLDALAERSRSEDRAIRDLILDLVQSDSFLTRPGGPS